MGNALPKAGQGTGPAGYDEDFYRWSQQQAELLRSLKLRPHNLDIENLATEIEDLGKRDFRSLQSHCATAIEHLLKLLWSARAEPVAGWLETVHRHHRETLLILEDSPSLSRKLSETWIALLTKTDARVREFAQVQKDVEPFGPIELSLAEFLAADFNALTWVNSVRNLYGYAPVAR